MWAAICLVTHISRWPATWNWKLEIEQIMWVQIPGFLTMRNRADDRPTAGVGYGRCHKSRRRHASPSTTNDGTMTTVNPTSERPGFSGGFEIHRCSNDASGSNATRSPWLPLPAHAHAARSRWRFEFPRNTQESYYYRWWVSLSTSG